MVKYLKPALVFVALIVLSVIVFSFFREESPEKQIKKQLTIFFTNASKPSGEKATTAFLKSKAIEKLFTPRCKVEIGVSSFSGNYTPIQISANSMRYRMFFKCAKLAIHDVEINLKSPSTASVDCTGSLSATNKRGESIRQHRDLTFNFELIENKWLIRSISVRKIIKR